MNIFSNYHCHTSFSDGKGIPEDFIKKAVELKMPSIGISEHAPLPFETKWNIESERVDEYIDEITNLKKLYNGKIELYCGMEVDFIPSFNDVILKTCRFEKLDYTIGAIHFLGLIDNGQPWNIDGSDELFRQGVDEIFKNDGKRMVENYYQSIIKMTYDLKPTIIGHIDKIKMHNTGDKYFSEESGYYRNAVLEALEEIKKTSCFVEINTRGWYKHIIKQFYPSLWTLKQMKMRNIGVVLSSDSHNADELISGFPFAVNILKEAGYRSQWGIEGGIWRERDFNDK